MPFNPTPRELCLQVISSTSLAKLAQLTIERCGFSNSDIGAGVIYPGDLDDSDRAAGEEIPEGMVELFLGWGLPDGAEAQVPESYFRSVLREVLEARGLQREAALLP